MDHPYVAYIAPDFKVRRVSKHHKARSVRTALRIIRRKRARRGGA